MIEVSRQVSLLLQYEHLPDFCYDCGFIGHRYKECTRKRPFGEEPSYLAKKKYGPWLNASVTRTRSLEERRRDKQRFDQLMGYSKKKANHGSDSADSGFESESRPLFKELKEWKHEQAIHQKKDTVNTVRRGYSLDTAEKHHTSMKTPHTKTPDIPSLNIPAPMTIHDRPIPDPTQEVSTDRQLPTQRGPHHDAN
ncbi:Zinc knuckle CX2CX4HX4C [Parasponia andersonii]|uniref:Zinc knuckle CX2CX4HX4C n=1 Tax=Parasponia andersonii TaxID=3476 RepID=A0A2P5C465_PARAD|nr:Zinc knuckle CX2CX4HX4C [Parasponia andersonii]